MRFVNRVDAGTQLAEKVEEYHPRNVIVYAIPRGGVLVASEVARKLHAYLDVLITRKITHPLDPEYAIGATAENGDIVGTMSELTSIDQQALTKEIERQRQEAVRRRKLYAEGKTIVSPQGKTAIIVDDGVATGLTLQAAIMELDHYNPQSVVVAVPVIAQSIADKIKKNVDALITIETVPDGVFLGSVGAYYETFPQVTDEEVIETLQQNHEWFKTLS